MRTELFECPWCGEMLYGERREDGNVDATEVLAHCRENHSDEEWRTLTR